MSDTGFDAGALGRRYAQLDELPESLWEQTLINPHGTLHDRVAGLLRWRRALLGGSLPDAEQLGWPDGGQANALSEEIRRLDLLRFCRGEADLTDALLLSVLDAVARGQQFLTERAGELFQQLRHEEEERLRAEHKQRQEREHQGKKATGTPGTAPSASTGVAIGAPQVPPDLDERTLAKLRAAAAKLAQEEVPAQLTEHLRGQWAERARLWVELSSVFGELATLLGKGWDLSQGLLRSQGWLEIMRLHELLKSLPALRELIQTLGRMQLGAPNAESPLEKIFVNVRRAAEERREVHSPLVPMETRGIERSGEIARMLPSEAVLLGHPILKRLWHARRAERGLMAYRVEGTDWETTTTEDEVGEEIDAPTQSKQRGPILFCLDTSGSMEGLPERVAKALALEALRTAHQEKRRLYLYLFSGRGQVTEQELSLSSDGIARLMSLLTLSFHGGTDVAAPLLRAVQRHGEEAWSRADILLVSDGEFPVPSESVSLLAEARERHGLRVHGVQIGGQDSTAMRALCDRDAFHRFSSWDALAQHPEWR